MKRITFLLLSIIVGVALVHPFSASAVDDPKNKKAVSKGPAKPAFKGPAKPAFKGPAKPAFKGPVGGAKPAFKGPAKPAFAGPGKPGFKGPGKPGAAHGPVVAGGGKFNRGNNYGGRWTAGGNFHPEWNHGQQHDWNGHHYRWYDGGWLIVDGGFWPVPGGPVYQGGGSLVAGAQQQLANLGYYNGPVDGVPGPGTRQAIANYQNDNNLPATGHLNYPTQQALGLQ